MSSKKIVDNNLIFLISQPRSGSTLLQKILGNHSEILTVGEPWILLPGLYNSFSGNIENMNTPYGGYTANRAIKYFENEYSNKFKVHKNALKAFYLEKYNGLLSKSGRKYFLDKTPRYYHIINEIIELFPNSKIIILLRNPLSVLNSIINTWTRNCYFKLGQFKDDLLLAPVIFSSLKGSSKNNNVLFVHYEDLVNSPDETINRILNFLVIKEEKDIKILNNERDIKWQFGDPENVYNLRSITSDKSDSWHINLKSRKFNHLALSYLKILGKETTQGLGYSYEELLNKINMAKARFIIPGLSMKFYFYPLSIRIGRIIKLIDAFRNKFFNGF